MIDKKKAERLEEVLNRLEVKAIVLDRFLGILRREIPSIAPFMLAHVGGLFLDARLSVTPTDESENVENG